jgi:hypothetical protein
MLDFNDLLKKVGLDPSQVQLIRHQDTRTIARGTPYHLWLAGDGRFNTYQSLQGPDCIMKVGITIASFVVTPDGQTLFAGLFAVNARRPAPPGTICPLVGDALDLSKHVQYDMLADPRLDAYCGRLVIDWGPGTRAWIQWAGRQPKPLLELKKRFHEPSFPGFDSFLIHVSEVPTLYSAWREVLKSVCGVYLLTCLETGEQYVGSAYGEGGFLGRFLTYAATNHGGNKLLKARAPKPYQVSILEVMSPSSTPEEVIQMEALWKAKLGSRAFGLNGN